MSLPALPPTLKPISPYIKLANEYDKRDGVVSYYCKYEDQQMRTDQIQKSWWLLKTKKMKYDSWFAVIIL